ncbi:MAG: enolase C-terminal domain-like protein [Verrucomicrobiota bacterium]
MTRIAKIRPVLLSAPYAHPESLEVKLHLPAGHRTCGLVEVTLEDGTTGLGEGYLAVFAPRVFEKLVELVAPYLIGKDATQIAARYADACSVVDYWSQQGAARHVVSALEIALVDAVAKQRGVPAWKLFAESAPDSVALYGSGGDSITAPDMADEIALLSGKGIGIFKIRARPGEARKAAWTLERAARAGIVVAVDMVQNLANPGQRVEDVLRFLGDLRKQTSLPLGFLEESLGTGDLERYPALRAQAGGVPIAGGEIVTTGRELCARVRQGWYDYAQPDATVIGGVGETLSVFGAAREAGIETVVHCWGAAVGMMANYHAAFAGGARLAEWPMPAFAVREALMAAPLRIAGGRLARPDLPGLGVTLTPELERRFAFREDAVYRCLVPAPKLPADDVWQ